jgi:hypothetical protein
MTARGGASTEKTYSAPRDPETPGAPISSEAPSGESEMEEPNRSPGALAPPANASLPSIVIFYAGAAAAPPPDSAKTKTAPRLPLTPGAPT